jgi:hypothetical protein
MLNPNSHHELRDAADASRQTTANKNTDNVASMASVDDSNDRKINQRLMQFRELLDSVGSRAF